MSDAAEPLGYAFERAADAYERGRPGYPDDAVAWLADELRLGAGRAVLDLAAGTGKLTRALAETRARVVAVEPGEEMRARLAASVPQVDVLAGTAEAIPLGDASVDAVTVAQAFHWFRPHEAVHEIHRVLRPGGGLAVLWNTRDEDDALQRAISELLAPLRRGAPARDEHTVAEVLAAAGGFGPVAHRRFRHESSLDEESFVARFLSVSFVAAAGGAERDHVERELRRLVRDAPRPIVVPYATDVFVAFRR